MGKILLTGATGFIGQALTRLNQDFRCVVRECEEHSFTDCYVVSTIDSSTEWHNCFHGVDGIIHLAGLAHSTSYVESDYRAINIEGTLRLCLKAAEAGVGRFVFVSSIGVNGTSTTDKVFTEHTSAEPHNIYAQSKYNAEVGLKKIAEDTGIEVVIVRPTLVYGANAPGNFGMLTKLVNKLPVLPFGLANNRRDFIAVQNLADLLVTCTTHREAAGHTFLASDGETVSTKQFTNAIAKGLGKKVIQLPAPVSLIRLAGKLIGKSAMIEQLFGNLEVDSSNAKDILGWVPPYTMEQAMASLSENKK
jgi:nucleoside-diphosphate-sugar epimerase